MCPTPPSSATSDLLEAHGLQDDDVDQRPTIEVPTEAEGSELEPQANEAIDPGGVVSEGASRSSPQRDDLALARWREMAGLTGKVRAR